MKRMKKYNLLLVIAGLILFCSCDKLLTTPPLDKIDEDAWLSNKGQVEMMVNDCYNRTWGESDVPFRDDLTDNSTNRNGNEKAIANGSYDSQNGKVQSFWRYEDIAHLNYVLESIEKSKSFLSDEDYKQYTAQVRFIRAFLYFDMMTLFGDVPLIKKTLTVTESKETGRAPRADVLQFILDELEKGVLVDIVVGETKGKSKVNKSVVEAFLSRIYLFEKNYQKTLEYTSNVIGSRKYELYGNFDKLFRPQSDKDATNREIIFERQYNYPLKGHSLYRNLTSASGLYSGWSWCLPLQNLVDEYECVNGHSMSECQSLGCEYHQKRIDEHTVTNRGEYLYRDPRFYTSIVYPYWEWITSSGKVLSTFGVDDPTSKDYAKTEVHMSGYLCGKWVDLDGVYEMRTIGEKSLTLIRYAEVLLNRAEALIESGGDLGEAANILNAIRQRAGMPENIMVSSQDVMREQLRHERRVETAFEGLRLYDIRRWRIAEKVMVGPAYGAKLQLISPDLTKNKLMETRIWSDKMYLFPVPQYAIDNNPKLLPNNPGWQ